MNRSSTLLRTVLLGQAPRRTKAFAGVIKGSMNDLPQPSGDFQVHHAAKQRRYMGELVAGAAFLTFTFGFGYVNNCFIWDLTPARPADSNDYSS